MGGEPPAKVDFMVEPFCDDKAMDDRGKIIPCGCRASPVATTMLLVSFLLIFPVAAWAEKDPFTIRSAHIYLDNKVYLVSADIHYSLTKPVLDALHNGVPLTIELRIELIQSREWPWWDETVAVIKQRYRLRYFALAQHYVLSNLNMGTESSYQTLDAALEALGRLKELPLLDQNLLPSGEEYVARMRVALDIESLPTPLRLLAYLSSRWRLTSEWYTWKPQL
ncbi:MAG TPA: DUF4390 domain-containing protein [Gammaproteobacteria bacterium]|nr:DUF4390 domain-containing protein [Gammaproteobacteria bacterium]